MGRYTEHKNKWQACDRCDLSQQRNRIVLARGKIPCDILFIGEAPGAGEDVTGKPFMGPAGKLLDQLIAKAIPPEVRCCMTNLVACFPREEKGKGNNEPPLSCIKRCRKRLDEFVKLARPRVVVAVGQLSKTHYQDHDFAIIHPAHILRMDPAQKPLAVKRCLVSLREAAAAIGYK